jgi:hypothetical protein
MRGLKIVFGLASGLFAGFQFWRLVRVLQEDITGTPHGDGVLAGTVVGLVLGIAICAVLLISAFSRRCARWMDFDLDDEELFGDVSFLEDDFFVEDSSFLEEDFVIEGDLDDAGNSGTPDNGPAPH